jgi:hypothetical protein
MATAKWLTAESAVSALTTGLNSLADGSFSAASSNITNSSDLYELMALEVNLAALSPATGAYIDIWIQYAIDNTNYATSGKPLITSALLTTFNLDTTASTAQRLYRGGLPIWPHNFNLVLRNKAGVALASSGNTLKYSRYNEQSV